MVRIIVICLVAAGLSGCLLSSERPLLEERGGLDLMGQRFVLAELEGDGVLSLNEERNAKLDTVVFERGRYVPEQSDAQSSPPSLSFHPLAGQPEVQVIQFVPEPGAKAFYFATRRFGQDMRLHALDLDEVTLAALKKAGTAIQEEASGHVVADRQALDDVLRLWSQINLYKLDDPATYEIAFRVATTPSERAKLQADAEAATCLALAGHPTDQEALARVPEKWRAGVPMGEIDTEHAVPACQAATRSDGSAAVRYALARSYEQEARYHEAEALLPKLLDEQYPLAYVLLADHRLRGRGVAEDPDAARQILEYGARGGMAMPAFTLGVWHMSGEFGEIDYAAARRWLGQAADGGVAEADYRLGVLKRDGLGGAKDESAAFHHFRKAGDGGSAWARFESGKALYHGSGMTKNLSAAYEDLLEAAKAGIVHAQYYVGFMEARGQGTPKAEGSAVSWLQKAEAAGSIAARAELGRMTYFGSGTTADPTEGKRLMEAAAKEGNETAQRYLAELAPESGGRSSSSSGSTGTRDLLSGKKVPADRRDDLEMLAVGKPFQLTEENLPFMVGLASDLLERCGAPSDDLALRTELGLFVSSGSFGSMLGFDYSNPNLGQAMNSQFKSQSLVLGGAVFGKQIQCGTEANLFAGGIAKALKSNAQGAGGGLSTFVKSCTPYFDQSRCGCLANVGRQAIPDLHRRSYDRRLIKEIIDRNPFVGLQIGLACQIGDY